MTKCPIIRGVRLREVSVSGGSTVLPILSLSGTTENFNKYPTEEVDYAGGMYDFESIMHYGNYLFSKNKRMTMVSIKNPRLLFGHKLRLSKTDIMQLNTVYDCKSKWVFSTTLKI